MIEAVPAAKQDRLLSIGAFAHRSRLSIKALRLYERSGLLMPAEVNPATGYRRYRERQLLRARLIVMMRRAGIPLAQVAEIIAAPGPAGAGLLAEYWADAERRFAVQRDLVSRLRDSLLSGAALAADAVFDVQERDVPGQLVITEKRNVRVTELKNWLPDALCRLASAAASHGGLGGELLAIYHGEVNEDSDGPVEVCAPVARPDAVPSGMAIRARPRTGRPMPRSPVRSSSTRRSSPPMTRSRTGSARLDWPGRARPARSTCKAWTLRRRHPANPSATSPTPSGARGRCTSGRR